MCLNFCVNNWGKNGSCLLHHVSSMMSFVSCLLYTSPVSHLLSQDSCLLSPISHLFGGTGSRLYKRACWGGTLVAVLSKVLGQALVETWRAKNYIWIIPSSGTSPDETWKAKCQVFHPYIPNHRTSPAAVGIGRAESQLFCIYWVIVYFQHCDTQLKLYLNHRQ